MSSTTIRGSGLSQPTQVFLNAPNYVNVSTMGSTGVLLSVPSGARYVRLAANLDYWLCWGSSGVETAAHTTGLGSEFVPASGGAIFRQVTTEGSSMVSALSTAAAILSQAWWSN